MNKYLAKAAYLALAWGIFINVSVVLNLNFALPLAAGGQFSSFPDSIRFIYFFQTLLLIYQIKVLTQLINRKPVRPKFIVKLFIFLGILGIFLNLISASAAERWNALPLGIITYAFFKLNKESKLAS